MSLIVEQSMITSDRINHTAWHEPKNGWWFTTFSGACFFESREDTEKVLRYAEFVEADGPHTTRSVKEFDALVTSWADEIDLHPEHVAEDLRTGKANAWSD